MLQMRDLSDSLASMVHAQMGQQAGQWQLLEDVNSVACNKYSQMAARLQEWMPLLEVRAAPLVEGPSAVKGARSAGVWTLHELLAIPT